MGPPQVKIDGKLDSENMGYLGNYFNGANIVGFIPVEQAMMALGLI